eukprot:snap_masked-scaffold_42-processed-gene-0.13-mRNA-1 protein AED:1.00 eAED:1.00 QI:0/0/0/0/1/1/2/0/67
MYSVASKLELKIVNQIDWVSFGLLEVGNFHTKQSYMVSSENFFQLAFLIVLKVIFYATIASNPNFQR